MNILRDQRSGPLPRPTLDARKEKVPRPTGLRKYEPLRSQLFEDLAHLTEGMSDLDITKRLLKDGWIRTEVNDFLSYRELQIKGLRSVRQRMWKGLP